MKIEPGSFRDPSGFIFLHDSCLYRQVNQRYREDFDFFIENGLYGELATTGLLVPHEETDCKFSLSENAYKVIKPKIVPFVSYPYEWSFSQLKDAALLTLEIQQKALAKGMTLKDASAYNIQFIDGRPIFIDTLSFERYSEGSPWIAYQQFCRNFLAPLAMMSLTDIRLNQFFRIFIDGVPLELASSLLPFKSKLSLSLGLHIHLHARSQRKYANLNICKANVKRTFTYKSFLGLLDSLHSAINKLTWKPAGTEWNDYYEFNNNYGEQGLINKERAVSEFLDRISPGSVWDLGANTGRFSRLAAAKGNFVVSWDNDPACVEINYQRTRLHHEKNILPLTLDLTNPSPGIGWNNHERMSLSERGPADTVFFLGLIHHLAISNNVPFHKIAAFCCKLCNFLIIEFVPKDDSQVRKLLRTRKDIFPDYTREVFEAVFGKYFRTVKSAEIKNTSRVLYLMERIRS